MLGIVADDLTGAMDSSGPPASGGLKTVVDFRRAASLPAGEWDVVCVNTHSRLLREDIAAERVGGAITLLMESGYERLYKKIDSTLRGNVGSEIMAMLRSSGAEFAMVCPAFPAMGRMVVDDTLLVHGRPLMATQEGHDAFSAVDTSSVSELLSAQTGQRVHVVPKDVLDSGVDAVEDKVLGAVSQRARIVAFDAETQDHLARIAEVFERRRSACIAAGSAGLAQAIVAKFPTRKSTPAIFIEDVPLLLLSGSLNPRSLSQIEHAKSLYGFEVIEMDVKALASGTSGGERENTRVVEGCAALFASGSDVGLSWSDAHIVGELLEPGERGEANAALLASSARRIVLEIVAGQRPSALVLVGGETAHNALSGLEADAAQVYGEVEQGIPIGRIIGGTADGAAIVTKGGGFGDEGALSRVVEYLRLERGQGG